jgi:subtilisin family serine protease
MTVSQFLGSGRYIVQFADGTLEEGLKILRQVTNLGEGVRISRGATESLSNEDLKGIGITVLQSLEMAIIEQEITQDQLDELICLTQISESPLLLVQEDLEEYSIFQETSRGSTTPFDLSDPGMTWGLKATGVSNSRWTGRGIKVAVLDTGFDFNHVDFGNHKITSKSFIAGSSAHDDNRYGTHVAGTICGPLIPKGLHPSMNNSRVRYGIAHEADLFVAKVANSGGFALPGNILTALEFAIDTGCEIINISIGTRTDRDLGYEALGNRALNNGSLIIAAAGNDAERPIGKFGKVTSPANAPSIMAVGAIDENGEMYKRSNRSGSSTGSEVDLAAPGVNIFSSMPSVVGSYGFDSGTSMAAPHVAGIAALYAQANPGVRGRDLWKLLIQNAKPLLGLDELDIGAGLVQAP